MESTDVIGWKELISKLEQAPNYFLEEASSLYRQRRTARRREQVQQSRERLLREARLKDADQQALWKAKYQSAHDELWYFGEFKDKGEQIRLLQPVKVIKRTAKQIHVISSYTMYCCRMDDHSEPPLWSTSETGGLFGEVYTGWTSITRYRLCRIHKTRLFSPSVLQIPQDGERVEERNAHNDAWRRLCNICLFASEDEYAKWHLIRYEDSLQHGRQYRTNKAHRARVDSSRRARQFPRTTLGLERNASREQIKAAYRRLAMRHHPDRGGDPDTFRRVKEAYENLKTSADC
jgi:hypothetical protein